jgi:hypothetical protein
MTTNIGLAGHAPAPAGALLPGQAHALRAAARFIERAGIAGLRVTAGSDGSVTFAVEVQAGPADARIAAAAALAAQVGAPAPERADMGTWELACTPGPGWLEGHDVRITTYISKNDNEGELP